VSAGSRWRATLLMLLKLTFSLGLIVFLLGRIPLDQLRDALRLARPGWLAAAFGLLVFSNVLGSYQWSRLLQAVDIRIPFWKVCAYYHVGLFFNNFLPANIGGDLARIADASRYGPTRTAALSAVMMDRIIGTVALGGIALLTTIPVLDRFHLTVVYFAVVGFFALGLGAMWVVFHPGALATILGALRWFGLGGLAPHLDELQSRLSTYGGRRALVRSMMVVAALTQISRIGVHVLVARALLVDVPIVYFFLFVPLLAVIVSLPISLNGIGVREGAGVVLFGLVGVETPQAFSLQFVTYLVAVAVSLLGGLVFLARLPRRRAEEISNRRRTEWT
jgi:glycosyltransferase 2 family protein